ncbi:hypothetical protein CO731_00312 [Aminobacter sp. MSH1]|uniref:hypothetical protein n=1 Tax=Aminobacter sp. MSH1 TaxID=374606 RepID=UPI000D383355|nr:hypothetical protein [Aminobacter sp. MSH1]AWC20871.1 hypothetical protein CO731_00312 [Aminobacter sp. MSH1]
MAGRIFISGLAAACLMSPATWADDADVALDFFHETCLAEGPDYDRTTELARKESWLPASEIAALAPVQSVNAFKAWSTAVPGLRARALIGVTKSTLHGEAVDTCTVAMFDGDFGAFEHRFFLRTDAEKVSDQSDGTQVSRLYVLTTAGRKQLAKITFPASLSNQHMIAASSIAPRRAPVRRGGRTLH